MAEVFRTGVDHLDAITALLRRRRTIHPTLGLYEAAELQWFWATRRPTDTLPQLYWFDDDGEPEAAALLFDFSAGDSLTYDDSLMFCPLTLPDASAEQVRLVVQRGLEYAAEQGIASVDLEVSRTDTPMHTILTDRGFSVKYKDVLTEAWLTAANRPEISPLADGYQLSNRAERAGTPHHLERDGREERLKQLSLYAPELDLVVLDSEGNFAGQALCWYDPVTTIGVIEPVRTHDDHQGRGLARHAITSGIDAMHAAGATRISIGWDPGNPATKHLYQSIGFVLATEIDTYTGPTSVS